MRNSLIKYVCGMFVIVGIAGFAFGTAHAQSSLGGGRLAGTWDARVTLRVCATGAEIASFASTANFNQGGTFSGITSATPPPGAASRSSERGIWSHVTGNLYRFRFKAYLFNAAGLPIGYQVVTHDLELDEKNLEYTSGGTAQFFAMDGTLTGSGCSTGIGSRMTLD
jgi:hypothetical protein